MSQVLKNHTPPRTIKRRRYQGKRSGGRIKTRSPGKKSFRMGPGAEPELKEIFSHIGKPPSVPFTPDPFQVHALESIKKTDCLVIAPTGAGKTWIAKEAISDVFRKGGRCWYASPLKALTNSKWVEFGESFGRGNVGILTGDTKDNTEAPIIVGTTEILRNQLYDAMHKGESLGYDLVILDEAHFLGDEDRGVVWEEIMIYLPARINLLLLSATVGNGREIAGWLNSIRGRECIVIKEDRRPVPLYPLFLHPSGIIMPLLTGKKIFKKVVSFLGNRPNIYRHGNKLPPFDEIIGVLRKFKLLPAIFFLKSRGECNVAVNLVKTTPGRTDKESFNENLRAILDHFPYLEDHEQLQSLRRCRVGAHHGGQLPAWKFMVETMMKKGHLDVVFATSTVAAGVNFPARSVVLLNSDQFNGREFLPLNAVEFHQMTGRAGRRGQDNIGFMLTIPQKYMDILHIRNLLFMKPEKIVSRIRNDFSMALNLLLSHTPEDIRAIFERSLANYQQKERMKKKIRTDLWEDFQRHLNFLKAEGFVNCNNRLTEKGMWTSQLRLDQPLLIAECLTNDAFPKRNEALLAAVVAPFVYDRDANIALKRSEQSKKLLAACDKIISTVAPISQRMKDAGFDVNPLPFWASVAIYKWAGNVDWARIVNKLKIADGDLAMLISRTADNLRQIASLKDTHPDVARCAAAARKAILREPVIFE
ncbi:MAG: DEAD/DEAH box helicase [Syntrophobacterales bacterium]|nr:DEAD/DEAH box helicase [Syntrophobacterales bacterium]